MATFPNMLTVAQYRELPEGGEFTYELNYGEVVSVTRPKVRHSKLQRRLMLLLTPKLAGFGAVAVEWPYRALSEYDLRAADVAVISHERWEAMDPDDQLRGAPDLVIEVKSPSNTQKNLREVVSLCLDHGAREVWIAEPEKRSVAVYRRGEPVAIYGPGASVPLTPFGADALAVDDIFNESSHR